MNRLYFALSQAFNRIVFGNAVRRAVLAYQSGNLREAEKICLEIVGSRRNNFDALHVLGIVQSGLGKKEAALTSYKQALKLRPDSLEVLFNCGWTLHELRRFEDAIVIYNQALAIQADHAEVLANRGLSLHELKRFDEALASFDGALKVRPDFAEALSNRSH